jgi:hypothetical protein
MAMNTTGLQKSGWGEVVSTEFAVVRGDPFIFMVATPGFRGGFAFTYRLTETYLLFLVSDNPDVAKISNEDLVFMLERRNVPFGMFVAYLGEDGNLFPIYNWALKKGKNGGFTAEAVIASPDKVLSEHAASYKEKNAGSDARFIERHYGARLKYFRETEESNVGLDMVGPSYLVSDEEWMHAWRGLVKKAEETP